MSYTSASSLYTAPRTVVIAMDASLPTQYFPFRIPVSQFIKVHLRIKITQFQETSRLCTFAIFLWYSLHLLG